VTWNRFCSRSYLFTYNGHVVLYPSFWAYGQVLEIDFLKGYDLDLLIDFGLVLLAGFIIGVERESKGKPAGITTHSFVIGGAMIFTYISAHVDPNSPSRIAAQLVTGVGFLGAGIILKSEANENLR